MIKTEERLIVDPGSAMHMYNTPHHASLGAPVIHQPYETAPETGMHATQIDEKPIFYDTHHDPCDMKQEQSFVIRYPPQDLYAPRIGLQSNVVKMQPHSPDIKYQTFNYQPLNVVSSGAPCMPTSTSIPLNSATSTIKYCGSSTTTHIGDVNTRKLNNISPSSSTIPQMGSPTSMNRQMRSSNDISTGFNSAATSSDALAVTKVASHGSNDPPSAPDTTKKSTGGRRAEKPPMSYINMIANAIKGSPSKRCTLNEIYEHLKKR